MYIAVIKQEGRRVLGRNAVTDFFYWGFTADTHRNDTFGWWQEQGGWKVSNQMCFSSAINYVHMSLLFSPWETKHGPWNHRKFASLHVNSVSHISWATGYFDKCMKMLTWKLETMLWSDQTSCKGHQRGAPLTHDLSGVITTLLRQYLVLMGRTTPIFQLGHYFDLNFTFVTVMSPYMSSLPHVCW